MSGVENGTRLRHSQGKGVVASPHAYDSRTPDSCSETAYHTPLSQLAEGQGEFGPARPAASMTHFCPRNKERASHIDRTYHDEAVPYSRCTPSQSCGVHFARNETQPVGEDFARHCHRTHDVKEPEYRDAREAVSRPDVDLGTERPQQGQYHSSDHPLRLPDADSRLDKNENPWTDGDCNHG